MLEIRSEDLLEAIVRNQDAVSGKLFDACLFYPVRPRKTSPISNDAFVCTLTAAGGYYQKRRDCTWEA
jgi:hypothetical protein